MSALRSFLFVPADSEKILWIGWEGCPAERRLCPRASFTHVVPATGAGLPGVCPSPESLHVPIAELSDRRALDRRMESFRPTAALVVFSGTYGAIAPGLRIRAMRSLRERMHPSARLLLVLSPVGMPRPERGSGRGDSVPVSPAAARRELRAAGWTLDGEPRVLRVRSAEDGLLRWTLVRAAVGLPVCGDDAGRRRALASTEPCLYPTLDCDQSCVFCSSSGEERRQGEREREAVLREAGDCLCIEGGEPTLIGDAALERLVAEASRRGARQVILSTHGGGLLDRARVRRLVEAGVSLFSVNFPAHRAASFGRITRTRGRFRERLRALEALVAAVGPERVRLTVVVHSLNYRLLPGLVGWVRRRFPRPPSIAFNLVKVLGRVRARPDLVPRLGSAAPYLRRALRLCREGGVRVLADGFPLCLLGDQSWASVDLSSPGGREPSSFSEKTWVAPCRDCGLRGPCAGPRTDYLNIHGDRELSASPTGGGRSACRS